jgi:hypothetical protein
VTFGAHMAEVIRFISKSERERIRLVRQARKAYDSIVPPTDPVREQRDRTVETNTTGAGNAYHCDGGLLS